MNGQKLTGKHGIIRGTIQYVSRFSSSFPFVSYLCFVGAKYSRKPKPHLSPFLSLTGENRRSSALHLVLSPQLCYLLIDVGQWFSVCERFCTTVYICQYLKTFWVCYTWEGVGATGINGLRPTILLNMLHCTAQPPRAKNYVVINVNSAENGNPSVGCNLPELSWGWGVVVG